MDADRLAALVLIWGGVLSIAVASWFHLRRGGRK